MLAYHITAACIIIIDMAIPLTRANRLASMRESDERITSIFHTLPARPPVCPSNHIYFVLLSYAVYEIPVLAPSVSSVKVDSTEHTG